VHRPQPHEARRLEAAPRARWRVTVETDLARRRRSKHLAFSYGDVFERGARTIRELRTAMEQ
jgi:hypothetical protein